MRRNKLIGILLFLVMSVFANAASLSQGSYQNYSFDKLANYKYTINLDVLSGDCDLYGHHAGYPTTSDYHVMSDNSGSTDESVQFDSTADSKYYISVYAYQDCSFNTPTISKIAIETIPSAPSRISPSGTITDTTPYIDWGTSTGATSYKLYLINNTDNQWIYNATSVTSSYKTSTTLTAGKTYRWWVTACNSSGCSSQGTTYNTFTIPT
ncbi:MAG: PPC domain-containing protein, partial [Bacteroidales bacterium]|nr:PPC domain-containing protein [Bacteroidales bacterium]